MRSRGVVVWRRVVVGAVIGMRARRVYVRHRAIAVHRAVDMRRKWNFFIRMGDGLVTVRNGLIKMGDVRVRLMDVWSVDVRIRVAVWDGNVKMGDGLVKMGGGFVKMGRGKVAMRIRIVVWSKKSIIAVRAAVVVKPSVIVKPPPRRCATTPCRCAPLHQGAGCRLDVGNQRVE